MLNIEHLLYAKNFTKDFIYIISTYNNTYNNPER